MNKATTGFHHPDIVSFGVRGVSTAYAGWSGVAYASHFRERSLTIDELVACELTVQALWCFTRRSAYRFLRILRFFALASFSLRCATP